MAKMSGKLGGMRGAGRQENTRPAPIVFITATDTGVGKTVATLVLSQLLKALGYRVGVMKPVQCAGDDAQFLKENLKLTDSLKTINPFFAPDPLSPHLAFQRAGLKVDLAQIKQQLDLLRANYDIVLIEGAGGLMVPLTRDYYVADLIKELEAPVVIVSRLVLGTINHTLLTINQAKQKGLHILGVLFNRLSDNSDELPEKDNPTTISDLTGIKNLGTISYLKDWQASTVVKHCQDDILLDAILALINSGETSCPMAQRSNKKFPAMSSWGERDKQHLWHPFTQMKDWLNSDPLVIQEAQGNYLIDIHGQRYLDGVSSLWVNVHGHRHAAIDQAIKNQIDRVSHSTFLGLSNIPAIQLAEKLVQLAPAGLTKVFYSDNGSTAVEVAIKMAYQYWQNMGEAQKTRLAHLSNSYHGDTLGSVSVGGIDLFHKVYRNLIFETIAVKFPDFYRAPEGKAVKNYIEDCLIKLEKLLKEENKSIAALIIEPIVQGAAGMIVWPAGILKKIEQLCKRFNVLLIADEVATGFGRTGKMFACEHEKVSPDFLCLAKGLTGGYLPLAATLTTQKIFDGFLFDYKEQKTFFHGHTYTANPLACAAALANLQVFEQEETLKKLQPKIKYLAKRLKSFYNLPIVGDIRQKGLMVGIELVKNRSSKVPFAWEEEIGVRVCQRVRQDGVILRPLGNVIVLMPPLSVSLGELNDLLKVVYKAIQGVLKERSG